MVSVAVYRRVSRQDHCLSVSVCSYVSVPEAPAFPLKISTGLEAFKFF